MALLKTISKISSLEELRTVPSKKGFVKQRALEGDLYKELMDFWHNGEEIPEFAGVGELRPHLRWKPGYVYCFTGYPGNGKSEFLNFLSLQWVKNGSNRRVAMYSPESYPVSNLVVSLIQAHLGIYFDPRRPYREFIDEDDWQASLEFIDNHYTFIHADDIPMSHEIIEVYNDMADDHGFFITDPFNYLADLSGHGGMSQNLQIALSRWKQFSVDRKVISTIVEHPKSFNGPIEERPEASPYALYGGSMWFNKMDVIASIQREDGPVVRVTVWKVKNQRVMGEPGEVYLEWKRGRYLSVGTSSGTPAPF